MAFKNFISKAILLFLVTSSINPVTGSPGPLQEPVYGLSDPQAELQKVRSLLPESKDKQHWLELRTRLAVLYRVTGEPRKALTLLKKNIDTLQDLENGYPTILARNLDESGELYYFTKDLEKARKQWERALRIRKENQPGNKAELAWSYSRLARYHSEMTHIDEAFDLAARSMRTLKGVKDRAIEQGFNVAGIYNEYAYALKVKKGQEHCHKAREASRQYMDSALFYAREQFGPKNLYRAEIFHDMGNSHLDQRHYCSCEKESYHEEKAIKYYRRSLKTRERLTPKARQKRAMTFFVMGLLHDYKDREGEPTKKGSKFYQKALVELADGDPAGVDHSSFTPPAFSEKVFNKALAVKVLIYKAKMIEERGPFERTKNLRTALANLRLGVQYWDALMKDYESKALYRSFALYWPPFIDAIKVCHELYQKTGDPGYRNEAFKYSEKGKNLHFLRNASQWKDPDKQEINNRKELVDVVSFPEMKQNTGEHEGLLAYYYGFSDLYLFWSGADTTAFIRRNVGREELHDHVKKLRRSIANREEHAYQKPLRYLDSLLLNPIRPFLTKRIERLRIIPHGMLATIPFGIFPAEKVANKDEQGHSFLIQDKKLIYGLSCTFLARKPENNAPNAKRISGFTPDVESFPSLPFSRKLIKSMEEKVEGEYFKGTVEKRVFLERKERGEILHLATHARANETEPRRSAIWFSDTALYLKELYEGRVSSPLVVLSACETGYGKFFTGEGVISFLQGFSYAGASSVLGTLWKVDDRTTNRILKNFYRYSRKGLKLGNALRKSKLEYLENAKRSEKKKPFYWAAPVLYGRSETLRIKEKESAFLPIETKWIALSAGGLLVLLLGFRWYKGSFSHIL